MNKLMLAILMVCSISLHACGKPDVEELPTENHPGEEDDDNPSFNGNGRYLVLYASRSGNTENIAKLIQSTLDADILEVEPTIPYESYDMIFVGYPIWHGHMATPMQAFLHQHAEKLSGKAIALFATSGSSGISTPVSEAQNLCANSTFTQTLLLTSASISQMRSRVSDWLSNLEINKDDTTNNSMKIKMTIGDKSVTATMVNNPTTRDLLSRLPLEITMTDYASAEKIFSLSPALTTQGTALGHSNPSRGDIDFYVPWGNVGVFYKAANPNNQLVNLGHIDGDGIEAFNVSGSINVKIERQ